MTKDPFIAQPWVGYIGGLRAERFKSGIPTHLKHGGRWYRLPRRYRKLLAREYVDSPFSITSRLSRAIWMDDIPTSSLAVDDIIEWLKS